MFARIYQILFLVVVVVGLSENLTSAITHQINFTYVDVHQRNIGGDQEILPGVEYTISTVCHSGVWILYPETHFKHSASAQDGGILQILPELEMTCEPLLPDITVGSIRGVGVRHDSAQPSATFFSQPNFEGSAFLFTEDLSGIPILENSIESLVTVNTHVQLFGKPFYQGPSYCLVLSPDNCKNGVCWMWHDGFNQDVKFNVSLAQSARIGCTPAATAEIGFKHTFNITFAHSGTIQFDSDHPHIPDEDEIAEYCRRGPWIAYEGFDYTTNDRGVRGYQIEASFTSTCSTLTPSYGFETIRSIRTVGLPYGSPSATFFTEPYFGGEKTVVENGTMIPVLPLRVKSMATLNTNVLYFERENFEGDSRCLSHNGGCSHYGEERFCWIDDLESLDNIWEHLPFVPKSAFIGCSNDV